MFRFSVLLIFSLLLVPTTAARDSSGDDEDDEWSPTGSLVSLSSPQANHGGEDKHSQVMTSHTPLKVHFKGLKDLPDKRNTWSVISAKMKAQLVGRFLCAVGEKTNCTDVVRMSLKHKLKTLIAKDAFTTDLEDRGPMAEYLAWVDEDMNSRDSKGPEGDLAEHLSWIDTCAESVETEKFLKVSQHIVQTWAGRTLKDRASGQEITDTVGQIITYLNDSKDQEAKVCAGRTVFGWTVEMRSMLLKRLITEDKKGAAPVYLTAKLANIFTTVMVQHIQERLDSESLFARSKPVVRELPVKDSSVENSAKALLHKELQRLLRLKFYPVAAFGR